MGSTVITELTVRTGNATLLSNTLDQLPMANATVVADSWNESDSTCRVRVVGEFSTGFVKYALHNQGYGTVVAETVVE